jgi:Zn-dependent protease
VLSSLADWSFRIGKAGRIEVALHYTFLFYIAIQLINAQDLQFEGLYLGVLFLSVLMHEFGHCLTARYFGLRADKIVLWPFGGLAMVAPGRTAGQDFGVALGGPVTHLPVALAAAAFLHFQGAVFGLQWSLFDPIRVGVAEAGTAVLVAFVVLKVQVALFCFNVLLPAYPMDGGRMLVALLLPRLGTERTGTIAMLTSGICGILLMVEGQPFIGFLLLISAAQLYQLRQRGLLRSHPSFSHTQWSSGAARTPAAPSMPKVVPLRPRGKQCPQCQRPLPDSAQMCGFCEIKV